MSFCFSPFAELYLRLALPFDDFEFEVPANSTASIRAHGTSVAMTSTWAGIDYQGFRKNVTSLHQSAGGRDLSFPEHHSDWVYPEKPTESDWLPFRVEKELAEDFAFLASFEDTPACVSAATISRKRHDGKTCSNIAANHGINKSVQSTFQRLLDTLKCCAQQNR